MVKNMKAQKRPRLSRCGRGCRRIGLDEMIHAHPEKMSILQVTKRKHRAA